MTIELEPCPTPEGVDGPWRLRAVVLGDPGAGKSTQAGRLAEAYHVPHVSTGELVREEVRRSTTIGRLAQQPMASGELLPDDLVLQLLERHLARSDARAAYVIDGFPRTLGQAQALQFAGAAILPPNVAVWLGVPLAELMHRLRERGAELERPDDNEESIARRLTDSVRASESLKAFYRHLGILLEVDGTGPIDEVTARLCRAVGTTLTPSAEGSGPDPGSDAADVEGDGRA